MWNQSGNLFASLWNIAWYIFVLPKEIGQFIGERNDDKEEGSEGQEGERRGGRGVDFWDYVKLDCTLASSEELSKAWCPGTTPAQSY